MSRDETMTSEKGKTGQLGTCANGSAPHKFNPNNLFCRNWRPVAESHPAPATHPQGAIGATTFTAVDPPNPQPATIYEQLTPALDAKDELGATLKMCDEAFGKINLALLDKEVGMFVYQAQLRLERLLIAASSHRPSSQARTDYAERENFLNEQVMELVADGMCGINQPLWETRNKVRIRLDAILEKCAGVAGTSGEDWEGEYGKLKAKYCLLDLRVESLSEALRRYGRHRYDCNRYQAVTRNCDSPCTCGWTEAEKLLATPETGEKA